LTPPEHMQRHGTLRMRDEVLALLKSTFDDRAQMMKLQLKVNNQLLAYQRRTDDRSPGTEQFLSDQLTSIAGRLSEIDHALTQRIKSYGKQDAVAKALLAVRGVGPITASACIVYIDFAKANSASALWAYVGLDKPAHQRYEKGVAGGTKRSGPYCTTPQSR